MWLLHVVVVQGGGEWTTAFTFGLLVTLAGGGFAWLVGEASSADALLCDLILAAAGGAALSLALRRVGTDPLAGIYGVRVFWVLLGAALALCLVHDAVRLLQEGRPYGADVRFPIRGDGGFIFLAAWLTGWPSEAGLVEATYGQRLPIKLLSTTLHYQVRRGPFAVSRTHQLAQIAAAAVEGDTLLLTLRPAVLDPEAQPRSVRLAGIAPPERARELADRIGQFVRQPG